jgi:hypothetical protein
LIDIARAIMEKKGVEVEVLRPVDYDIAYGARPAMRTHGRPSVAWPGKRKKVLTAQLMVVASSIFWGQIPRSGLLSSRQPESYATRG